MPERPTVLITGGGTGGHVYPALAIAEGLRPFAEVVYVGDARKLEARVVPPRGLPFVGLVTQPFPRRGVVPLARFLPRLAWNVLQAMGILRRYRPRLVVGVGGYVSAPLVIAAGLRRVRVALHEQNVRPGVANLKLQRYASLILLSYEGARPYFDADREIVVTGCPVNPNLGGVERAEARPRLGFAETDQVVLVVGGSGGAEALNNAVVGMLPRLVGGDTETRRHGDTETRRHGDEIANCNWGCEAAETPRHPDTQTPLHVYHITGPRYFDDVSARVAELGLGEALGRVYQAVPYSDEIQYPYAAADLIVCRAGSATLNEITTLGRPAILVPSPNVTDNHQEINARELETHGAAEVLREADLTGETLYAAVSRLCADKERLAQMSAASRALARGDAQAAIVRALRPLLEE